MSTSRSAVNHQIKRQSLPETLAESLRERIEGARVHPELPEPVGDHAVVLGLVSRLAGEGHLHLDVGGDDEPARRDLGGLDLVLEGDLQEVRDVERPAHLRLEGGVGLEPAEDRLVGLVERDHELGCGHAASPCCRSPGSSWVRVSLVTTRRQRVCSGWVSRASAWVVKPSTGTPGAAARASKRAS